MARLTIFIGRWSTMGGFEVYQPQWKIGFDVLAPTTDYGLCLTPPCIPPNWK